MRTHFLKAVNPYAHSLHVAEENPLLRVMYELVHKNLPPGGGHRTVNPTHAPLGERLLQNIHNLDMPCEDNDFFYPTFQMHAHIVSHLRRLRYAHHPTHH